MATPQVIRADALLRRQALLLVLGGILVGILVVRYGVPWLDTWVVDAVNAGNTRARLTVCLGAGALIVALALLVAASGVNILRISRRAIRAARFPPPGVRVIRDTRVIEGRPAVLLGRVQAALAAALLACAAILLALGAYVVVALWP